MAITINIPQHTDSMTPLGALIAHFNSSSKSVRRAFSKMLTESVERERQEALNVKIQVGMNDILNGRGISRKEGESTEQFFERLCTE